MKAEWKKNANWDQWTLEVRGPGWTMLQYGWVEVGDRFRPIGLVGKYIAEIPCVCEDDPEREVCLLGAFYTLEEAQNRIMEVNNPEWPLSTYM